VATFNQKGNGSGWGIFLEAGEAASMSTVSITQSSIHDFDTEGIRSNANTSPPALTVNIKNNSVAINKSPTLYSSAAAIDIDGIGVISGNSLIGPSSGIGIALLSNLRVLNNTIEGLGIGIWPVGSLNTIKSNRVSMAEAGIIVSGNSNDVEYNSFMNLGAGNAISFNCMGTSNTVTHNRINDSAYGIETDPGGNTVKPNSFSNVTNVSGPTC